MKAYAEVQNKSQTEMWKAAAIIADDQGSFPKPRPARTKIDRVRQKDKLDASTWKESLRKGTPPAASSESGAADGSSTAASKKMLTAACLQGGWYAQQPLEGACYCSAMQHE